jgi:putative PIN family toxin of toxin-antitoxin system
MKLKLVIDTNVLVASLSSKSKFHWLIQSILNEQVDVFVTTDMLFEYEEILKQKYSTTVADNFLIALKELPNVHFVQIFFKWDLLKDADDNKFIDCYVAGNAQYLLTSDRGFNILKSISFPPVNIIDLSSFSELLMKQ